MSADNPQYALNWNNYASDLKEAFNSLLKAKEFVDVTLSCEGKKISAHKMFLSACSTYFHDLFRDNPCQHPIVIFRDVKFQDLEYLLTFMYTGEVSVPTEHLDSLLKTAELLHVSGLPDNRNHPVNAENEQGESHNEAELSLHTRPLLKRHAQTAQDRAETTIDGRNDNSNASQENPSKRLKLEMDSTINTEIKRELVEVLKTEPEELPLDDTSNTLEENPTIITEIKYELVEVLKAEPEELPSDDNFNTSEENPTIITEMKYDQVEVLKAEPEELPSDDNFNTSEENPTIITEMKYDQVEVLKAEPEELPSDDNFNTSEENPTIITEMKYEQVEVLKAEPEELPSDDNFNTSEENPTIITEMKYEQVEVLKAEPEELPSNDNFNTSEENPTIITEMKYDQVEVLKAEPEELPSDDNFNTSEENPTIITEMKYEQVEVLKAEPEELPSDDNFNTSEENPTIITEMKYEQVEVLKAEPEELPSNDNFNTSEANLTIITEMKYEQVEVLKAESEELPSDDNFNTSEENPTIITEMKYEQVEVLKAEPEELPSDDNFNTSEESPAIIKKMKYEQVEVLKMEPEELPLDDSLLINTEKEIDVVSVGEEKNVSNEGTYSLQINPSSPDRQQLQRIMASAINGKQIRYGSKTLPSIRKSSSEEQTPIKKQTSEARAMKSSRHYRNATYKRSITCAQSSDSDAEPLERCSLHNDMERQRRIDLTKLFLDLRIHIPAVRSREKASKILILKEAGFYCDHLGSTSVHLNKHLKELQKQQHRLRARLSKLRKNFVAKY